RIKRVLFRVTDGLTLHDHDVLPRYGIPSNAGGGPGNCCIGAPPSCPGPPGRPAGGEGPPFPGIGPAIAGCCCCPPCPPFVASKYMTVEISSGCSPDSFIYRISFAVLYSGVFLNSSMSTCLM